MEVVELIGITSLAIITSITITLILIAMISSVVKKIFKSKDEIEDLEYCGQKLAKKVFKILKTVDEEVLLENSSRVTDVVFFYLMNNSGERITKEKIIEIYNKINPRREHGKA